MRFLERNRNKRESYLYLHILLLLLLISNVINLICLSDKAYFFYPLRLNFLLGPVFFFYHMSLLKSKVLKTYKSHLLPGILELLTGLVFLFREQLFIADFLRSWNLDIEWVFLIYLMIGIGLIVYYLRRIFKSILLNKKEIVHSFGKQGEQKYAVYRNAVHIISMVYLLYLCMLPFFHYKFDVSINFASILFLILCIYTYYIPEKDEIPQIIEEEIENQISTTEEIKQRKGRGMYGMDDLEIQKFRKEFEKIQALVENEECYLDKELSLVDLANYTGLHYARLSRIIKIQTGENFNTFINRYRIQKSMKILSDQAEGARIKLEVLALDVGFKTRKNFHASFKKETGMTPADFRKKMLESDQREELL